MEKLRQLAGTRELALSADVLSAGLLAHVASAAPASAVAGAIGLGTGGAAAAATPPVAAIAKGAIQMMNLMRMRIPLAAGAALLVLAAVGVSMLDAGEQSASATAPATRPAAVTGANAPATTAPAAVAAAAAAAAAAEDSPKAVVFAAFRAAAAGDADGLLSRFDRLPPAQAQTLRQTTEVMSAADRLSKAIAERFGPEVEQQFTRTIGMGVGEFDVTSALETIQGDSAIVEMKAGPGDIRLVRAGATWKISGDALRTLNAGAVRQLHAAVPAIDRLTADVRAGKYKTPDELRQTVTGIMRASRNRPATTRGAAAATTTPAAQPR